MAVRPAHAGDPLNKGISASDWNALNEMRRRKSNASIIGTTATDDALDGIVTVKNTTGNNLPPGSIVGLDAPFILPDGTSDDARLMLNFQGVVPTDGTGSTTDYTGRFGILLDGVSGEYGAPTVPARIFDGAYCKLYMQSATDQFADIEHNNTTRLKSGSSGSAQILYHYPMGSTYPQETYGYVRLGNRASDAAEWAGRLSSAGSAFSSEDTVGITESLAAGSFTLSSSELTASKAGYYRSEIGGSGLISATSAARPIAYLFLQKYSGSWATVDGSQWACEGIESTTAYAPLCMNAPVSLAAGEKLRLRAQCDSGTLTLYGNGGGQSPAGIRWTVSRRGPQPSASAL